MTYIMKAASPRARNLNRSIESLIVFSTGAASLQPGQPRDQTRPPGWPPRFPQEPSLLMHSIPEFSNTPFPLVFTQACLTSGLNSHGSLRAACHLTLLPTPPCHPPPRLPRNASKTQMDPPSPLPRPPPMQRTRSSQ